MKKRILVVGNYSCAPAEGMQVITKSIFDFLSCQEDCDCLVMSMSRLFRSKTLFDSQSVDICIFTHGPGLGAVLASRALSFLIGCKVIFVATRPDLGRIPDFVLRIAKVDAIYSNNGARALSVIARSNGVSVDNVPIGYDPSRVCCDDITDEACLSARMELFGAQSGSPVLLHVGHLRSNRNLEALLELKHTLSDRVNILIVASPTLEPDKALLESLRGVGIVVLDGYLNNIALIYRMADLYIFPVRPSDRGAIDFPLSVLEALRCGLPVVTTRFGVLPEMFSDCPAMRFICEHAFVEELVELIESREYLEFPVYELPEYFSINGLANRIYKEL